MGPIPESWRHQVISILRGDDRKILTTKESDADWQNLFPASFTYERYEAMATTLQVEGVLGKRIWNMVPEGEVYAFFFYHEGIRLYGKINLLSSGEVILIYSNHPPEKGDRL